MAAKTATHTDVSRQLIINQVCALVEYHLDRHRDAGRTPDEIAQERAALIAGIVAANRTRSPQP